MNDDTRKALDQMVVNAYTQRQAWLQKLLDPRRDINLECGYPDNLAIQDYYQLWERSDVAARVVSLWPEETWNCKPSVYETEEDAETEFEMAWDELNRQIALMSYLRRADIMSGIGRFGIVLLGIDDGLGLEQPVETLNEQGEKISETERRLLYLRPLDESLVTVQSLETDLTNPRYGQPKLYQVQFSDSAMETTTTKTANVHWTRVIHLADNRTNSEIYGVPRMQVAFNRLLDLRKTAGGSAEMFWRGGFPGLSVETPQGAGVEDITVDAAATKEQLTDYMNGLQRYLLTVGLQVKTLPVEIADPRPHVEIQMKLIATAIGVPWRVFIGSEAAQLASEQDTASWNRRLQGRREDYVTPFILRPFINRLIDLGVLPDIQDGNSIIVDWPDPNAPTDDQKATTAEKQTNAIAKYVQAGADALIPEFMYLTLILGMSDDEARAVVEEAEKRLDEIDGQAEMIEEPVQPIQPVQPVD